MSEHRYHYWLTAHDETGKPYLVYGCPVYQGEEYARQKGLEMLPGVDFEIKKLPTRDMGRASSMIRGARLEQTHSLEKAGKRIGHNKSLKRLRRGLVTDNNW